MAWIQYNKNDLSLLQDSKGKNGELRYVQAKNFKNKSVRQLKTFPVEIKSFMFAFVYKNYKSVVPLLKRYNFLRLSFTMYLFFLFKIYTKDKSARLNFDKHQLLHAMLVKLRLQIETFLYFKHSVIFNMTTQICSF